MTDDEISLAVIQRLKDVHSIHGTYEYPGFIHVAKSTTEAFAIGNANEFWTIDLVADDGNAEGFAELTGIKNDSEDIEQIADRIADLIKPSMPPQTIKITAEDFRQHRIEMDKIERQMENGRLAEMKKYAMQPIVTDSVEVAFATTKRETLEMLEAVKKRIEGYTDATWENCGDLNHIKMRLSQVTAHNG